MNTLFTLLRRPLLGLCLFSLLALLSACGGGGGDGGGGGGGGANNAGPSPNSGTVLQGGAIQTRALTSSGIVTTPFGGVRGFLDGTGTAAQFDVPVGITTDGANLYVADSADHRVRKIVIATGVVTTLAGDGIPGALDSIIGTAAQFNGPRGITTDGASVYVADTDNHRIRQIVITTGEVTTLAGSTPGFNDATGVAAQFDTPRYLTTDGARLFVADTNNHRVRQIVIATGAVTTLAGDGTASYRDDTGMQAQFNSPRGITTDGTNLYVADLNNHRTRQVVIATGAVTTLAGDGTAGNLDNIVGTAAQFNQPVGITSDGTNLYVADTGNRRIRKIVIATGTVTTLAGSSRGFLDATGTGAQFDAPAGMTTDGMNLYVADPTNNRIRKIDGLGLYGGAILPSTALSGEALNLTGDVTTVAGSTRGYLDGPGTSAMFFAPYGVTTDGVNLYVADHSNHRIRQISIATSDVSTVAGDGSGDFLDGVGTAARFQFPESITSDGKNLYVADTSNHRIRRIVSATGAVTTLAGSGSFGFQDGLGTAAQFHNPKGITTDGANLYVADSSNHRIRKIVIATGEVTTLAGDGTAAFLDATGTSAQFNRPEGIATDGTNLYIADSSNYRVRRIEIATTVVTTLAGDGTAGFLDDPVGTLAQFNWPHGMLSDGTNLYVADDFNDRIRRIVIATGEVTTAAGSGVKGNQDGDIASAKFNTPNGIATDGAFLYVADISNQRIRRVE